MSLLADLTLLLHAAFIVFVLLGGLLVLRWRRLVWLHLPCVAWGILIELGGWICPLTPLENTLRAAAGHAGYDSGFIEHYLGPLIYPAGLTSGIQYLLAAIVLLLNAAIYVRVWRRWR
ncbi:MAG: DUF2784 domain-containing protein [Pseudomonadota bacterium]